jgi:hypothetical protein
MLGIWHYSTFGININEAPVRDLSTRHKRHVRMLGSAQCPAVCDVRVRVFRCSWSGRWGVTGTRFSYSAGDMVRVGQDR